MSSILHLVVFGYDDGWGSDRKIVWHSMVDGTLVLYRRPHCDSSVWRLTM